MAYKKITIKEFDLNPFDSIGEGWLLITGYKDGVVNTMTASWGGLGILWSKPVATVFVRPERYTKEFIDQTDYFTITFFNGYKKELGILGTKSGRDGDKIKEVDFHVEMIEDLPSFQEGTHMMICKKLYVDSLKQEKFLDQSIFTKNYTKGGIHDMYIAQIESIYQNIEE